MFFKTLSRYLAMETAMLDGNKTETVETSELVLRNAESAFALMGTVCNAVKEHRWNEVEEMLRSIQWMVHQLRVDVRDERLPFGWADEPR
jgi:hypothetical protein